MSDERTASPIERAPRRGWLDVAEKGSVLGLWFFVHVGTLLGRGPARLALRFVAFYYVVVHASVRRASRDYFTRLGQPPTFGRLYQHVLRFGEVALDRLFIITRKLDCFRVSSVGHHHLAALEDEKRGAILLGAHLGSFEAMRMRGAETGLATLNIVGNFGNARMINAALEKLSPGLNARVINLDESALGSVLQIKERVQRGELVAVLGDRVPPGARYAEVDFLGGRARFPTGPFLLASILRCPVYLTFGLHFAPDRYQVHCEPFTERVELPRGRGGEARDEALRAEVQRFATRLEHYVRLAPDNWFNFYDFWEAP